MNVAQIEFTYSSQSLAYCQLSQSGFRNLLLFLYLKRCIPEFETEVHEHACTLCMYTLHVPSVSCGACFSRIGLDKALIVMSWLG